MEIKLIEKNASFLFDEKGVIIITDIDKIDDIVMGELLYDGKNVAILNRNNKEFFAFKNIAPIIRDKIKQSKDVTIIEKDFYSYQVEVHLKDDFGFEDDFDKHAQEIIEQLKKKMKPADFQTLLKESAKFIQEIEIAE